MITASIYPNLGDIFTVEAQIQVNNRPTALILEHILNHLTAMSVFDAGYLSPPLIALLREAHNWPTTTDAQVVFDQSRARLVDELHQLLDLLRDDSLDREVIAAAYAELGISYLSFDPATSVAAETRLR